jgi:predicted esterase
MIESQRAWYNLHDETEWDAIAESELNESLAHVFLSSKGADGRPIYDGIIGFSQGAVLASILIKKHPNLFKYFIAISGYQTTAPKYSSIYSQPIDKLSSLHIYGLNDKMVDPVRSEALSKWFLNNRVKTHTNGHFAPDSWPSDQIASFIAEQSAHIQPTLKSFSQIVSSSNTDLLRLNVHEVNFNLQRFDLDELDLEVMFESQQAISLFRLIKNNEQVKTEAFLFLKQNKQYNGKNYVH